MQDTLEHIDHVEALIHHIASLLLVRGIKHDASKLQEPELSGYVGLAEALKGLEYGTPEYRSSLASFRPVIAHHYANNDHHPEHFQDGVAGMNILQFVEMLCDWKAASLRSSSSLAPSLDASIKRFGIDDQLASIIKNTVRDMGW